MPLHRSRRAAAPGHQQELWFGCCNFGQMQNFAFPNRRAYSSCFHQHISKAVLQLAMLIRGCKMPNATEAMATMACEPCFLGKILLDYFVFLCSGACSPLPSKRLSPKGLNQYVQCRRFCLKYLYLRARSTTPLIPITSAQDGCSEAPRHLLPQGVCSLPVGAAPSLLQGAELPLIS